MIDIVVSDSHWTSPKVFTGKLVAQHVLRESDAGCTKQQVQKSDDLYSSLTASALDSHRTAFSFPSVSEFALRPNTKLNAHLPARGPVPHRRNFARTSSAVLSQLRCKDESALDHVELPQAIRFHTSNQVGQTFNNPRLTTPPTALRGEIKDGILMVDGLKTFYKTVLPNTPVRGAHPLVLVHGFGMSSEHFAKNMHEIADAIGAP
eukprot:2214944-Rhodomonas_salina.1